MRNHRAIRRGVLCAVFTLSLVAVAASAQAERKVYLNGVDLSDVDVRGHHFKRAEVRFDDKGNVYIKVKGLKVEKKPAARPADPRVRPAAGASRDGASRADRTGRGGGAGKDVDASRPGGDQDPFTAAVHLWLQGH